MLSDIPWPRPHRINQFTIPSPPRLTLLEGEWGNWVVTIGRVQNNGINKAASAGLLQDKKTRWPLPM